MVSVEAVVSALYARVKITKSRTHLRALRGLRLKEVIVSLHLLVEEGALRPCVVKAGAFSSGVGD